MTRLSGAMLTIAMMTLSACAQFNDMTAYKTGTLVTPAHIQQLKVGQSTVQDVTQLLGPPQSIENAGKDVHYVYNYTEINHLAANKSELTRIIFSPDEKLKQIQQGAGIPENPLLGTR